MKIKMAIALAGVAQWIECQPVNQRVAALTPNLGHMPGLWARSPCGGHVTGNHILMFLSVSVSFPSPLSKK